MRNFIYSILLVSSSMAQADSIFNFGSNNSVSSGKIIINGKEVSGSSGNYLKGSGNKTKESRDISAFKSIKIAGTLDLNYSRGQSSLQISGDENILSAIKTEVNGGELQIFTEKNFSTDMPIIVTVSSPELDGVTVEGSSDVSLNGISSDRFLIKLNGTGDIIASGKAESLIIEVFGSGDVNTKRLSARIVEASLSGTGDLELTASESLNATVSGAGDIVYYGNPRVVNRNAFGAGDISSGD